MSVREIDSLFNRGLELMRKGNYQEAESFFVKAKNMTLELQKK
jgi:outer membrane protein assembly factor BamD (BamD/ComL family)